MVDQEASYQDRPGGEEAPAALPVGSFAAVEEGEGLVAERPEKNRRSLVGFAFALRERFGRNCWRENETPHQLRTIFALALGLFRTPTVAPAQRPSLEGPEQRIAQLEAAIAAAEHKPLLDDYTDTQGGLIITSVGFPELSLFVLPTIEG